MLILYNSIVCKQSFYIGRITQHRMCNVWEWETRQTALEDKNKSWKYRRIIYQNHSSMLYILDHHSADRFTTFRFKRWSKKVMPSDQIYGLFFFHSYSKKWAKRNGSHFQSDLRLNVQKWSNILMYSVQPETNPK